MVSKEKLLDRISILLIENFSHPNMANQQLSKWQQAIVSGSIVYNTNNISDEILMFGSDVVANSKEDSTIVQWLYDYMKQNNLELDSLTFNPDNLEFKQSTHICSKS